MAMMLVMMAAVMMMMMMVMMMDMMMTVMMIMRMTVMMIMRMTVVAEIGTMMTIVRMTKMGCPHGGYRVVVF
eukprot:747328-Karenia_brevis.AAC.1